ncbi:PH domain-containing protein [Vagococcus vulneris]|uniref:YdbS-like PH domain-containing protein n=1 Tax=Vagococcus vulneris TaxID=1977869 RepID=A0A429ZY87_9ENTE|nr:PH domain-containing protein [Vagococcus vulneris]RST98914.1 hypothetical protein CBF37_05960 [Vagococcus vulneris]
MTGDYPLLKNKMPKTIKKVWYKANILSVLIMLVIGVISVAVLFYLGWWRQLWLWPAVIYFGMVAVVGIVTAVLVPYRYAFHRYEVTSDDLAFQEGYFFRSTTYVPINRIQHVETEQGPFLRKEDLMELVVNTAATRHKISGLTVSDAVKLRQQIIDLVKVTKEDV